MHGGPVFAVQLAVFVVQLGAVGPDDGGGVFAVQPSVSSPAAARHDDDDRHQWQPRIGSTLRP